MLTSFVPPQHGGLGGQVHRYLTLVRQKHGIHNDHFIIDIILELPPAVDPVVCAVFLLVREPEHCKW